MILDTPTSQSTNTSNADVGVSSSPLQLGVNQRDQFTNSYLTSFLNSTVRSDDFCHIVIEKGSGYWVTQDTVITALMTNDSFSLELGNEYSRPLFGEGASLGGALGRDFKGIGSISQSFQELTGTALYSKVVYTPIWKQTKIPQFTLNLKFVATGNPENEVELPLLILSKLLLPTNKSNYGVIAPGPFVNLSTFGTQLANSQSASDIANTFKDTDPASLIDFTNSYNISLVLGDLMVAKSCIITNLSYTVPNTRTTNESTGISLDTFVPTYGKSNFKSSAPKGTRFYRMADVTVTFQPVFPPENTQNNDLGNMVLFPSKNYVT